MPRPRARARGVAGARGCDGPRAVHSGHRCAEHAFAAFERARRNRVEAIVKQSRRNGTEGRSGPIGEWVRDRVLPFFLRLGTRLRNANTHIVSAGHSGMSSFEFLQEEDHVHKAASFRHFNCTEPMMQPQVAFGISVLLALVVWGMIGAIHLARAPGSTTH